MAMQNGCSALSYIPTLDLIFLHKNYAPQTRAGVE